MLYFPNLRRIAKWLWWITVTVHDNIKYNSNDNTGKTIDTTNNADTGILKYNMKKSHEYCFIYNYILF